MEIPESWKRMKDDFVAQTEAWGRGISEEMSFLGSRLKEFWDDPEKLISTPAEQGAILPELGMIPQMAVENVKGERSRELWERMKAGDPEAMTEYAMSYMGETGGILRKAAVKKLAVGAKGIIKTAQGATEPLATAQAREGVKETLKRVIPAMRKLDQEWWDPVGDAQWKFFRGATKGDIAAEGGKTVRFHPYVSDERTVFHEVAGHGGQYAPGERIQKALVPYKGELVPAKEVLDYMTQVSRSWRGKNDYMEKFYGTDPTEMHARVVAKDIAGGMDPEEAFLNRLPKVVKSFEATHPDVAQHYRTPLLERVASKAEERQFIKSLEQRIKELD